MSSKTRNTDCESIVAERGADLDERQGVSELYHEGGRWGGGH